MYLDDSNSYHTDDSWYSGLVTNMLIMECEQVCSNPEEYALMLKHNVDGEEITTEIARSNYSTDIRAAMYAIHARGYTYNKDGSLHHQILYEIEQIASDMTSYLDKL